ncbi:PAS domain-containing hybrid sensor histidine kinase/response regulator [Caulobacter endophyticus]|uniref:histidine kinase n=1 Tax=Caulobacter endophyticus TaxID=2172652 RepID=A0A2T9KCI7_9CAUL|nr:PAS domain-containing hybrid sensor histidine kinase/response regulator [Caulobacter endophyticus]PVM93682.1 hybrid sensor histidine kinase/response regulator [Caulobacter endophyticus]
MNPLSPSDLGRLYDLAPCGLATFDAELTILSANPYFLDVVGLSRAEMVEPIKLTALLSVASRIYLQGRLQAQLALTGRVDEIVLDVARPDGQRVPVVLNACQERDAGRPAGRIHISLARAAARRAYEAEVPKARQEAIDAKQVKADFLANVSHEIRTPLNGVVGVVGALQRTELSARQRDMVALIESSAVTLERLVGDILEISRVEALALTLDVRPFRPREELDGVLELAGLAARAKGVAFESVCDAALDQSFLGDSVRLKQILTNLTSNAVKFTQEGLVRVTLGLGCEGQTPQLVISVEDSGIGFDQAQAEALFQPFHQADAGISRRFGGVGLGLSIARSLVDLMGGTITVRSAPGEGSTFSVSIPLGIPEALAGDTGPSETLSMERSLRILLVEDNETNQRVVSLILAEADVALTITSNGALGLDAWREADFDLVLMDMQMPVMDGLTAIRTMRLEEQRSGRARTPIAVLSANAMDHHRDEALAAGADLHIAKPISASGLFTGIQNALTGADPAKDLVTPETTT